MNTPRCLRSPWGLIGALLWALCLGAAAEPPLRAARLGATGGTVSFLPAGQPDWVQAATNRPLTTGDRLWTDRASRAEVQLGGAALRMGADTDLALLNVDDRVAQLLLAQGALRLRVRSLGAGQRIEVDTPNLAVTLRRSGDYRIDVDADGDATVVRVLSGQAELDGEGDSFTLGPRQGYRFTGQGLADRQRAASWRDDDLDRWSRERDRRTDTSTSARYVSTEVVGYEDLDANGRWRDDPEYGSVWTPTRVAVGWTPYRDGHWAWIDPWGWTWVDDAPWGYAVSHYGRWARIGSSWSWVPGPRRERAVYAPALVAFVGGGVGGLQLAATISWFPLAPREVYRPSYPVSRAYFDTINRSNAVIAPTVITNIYNTTIVNNTTTVINVKHANQQVRGAVVAVPTQTFVRAQPVARAMVKVDPTAGVAAAVTHGAMVAPLAESVQGGARVANVRPPERKRAVVARTAPPPPAVPFAQQLPKLATQPGRPIDAQARQALEPAARGPQAPAVKVVTPQARPLPVTPPPAARVPAERSPPGARTPPRAEAAPAPKARVEPARPVERAQPAERAKPAEPAERAERPERPEQTPPARASREAPPAATPAPRERAPVAAPPQRAPDGKSGGERRPANDSRKDDKKDDNKDDERTPAKDDPRKR